MQVLEDCKCMFRIEHKFISNSEKVGIIGHVEPDYITRYNFGLCKVQDHIDNKMETEKIKQNATN